jgi:hypothetical protein
VTDRAIRQISGFADDQLIRGEFFLKRVRREVVFCHPRQPVGPEKSERLGQRNAEEEGSLMLTIYLRKLSGQRRVSSFFGTP